MNPAGDDTSLNHLLASIARSHRNLAGGLLRQVGLFPGQELLLMRLWNRDHQPQADLVTALRIEAPTVTKMLKRLEAQGFVTRHRPPDNQRIVIVSLSDKGRGLRREVESLWGELEEAAVGGLTEAERRQTLEVLHCLERRLSAAQASREPRPSPAGAE
ncbi:MULTISPECIES: MarR family winged helix-turn-helix transcriptional regulator [unclassified Streptomyces]|uniref:MarR family winged helix-turn-helix transcriptional regulator n=1 Tax=unclassified Streptomyces TaxID=2593676 RepID=UPI001C0E2779|nr:MarR family winged helix-turn-helix transcriptional regulator [Streptomyces sp. YPW6]QWQ42177.1 MarR family winged helix-turn-helix transcriptional regulator [Streptomyces sp. YPW6]